MKLKLTAVLGAMLFTFDYSFAGEFDGWCFPANACTETDMLIKNNQYETCEQTCKMSKPVNVNDLDAVLYYVTCRGDGPKSSAKRVFMIKNKDDKGKVSAMAVDQDGFEQLVRCK